MTLPFFELLDVEGRPRIHSTFLTRERKMNFASQPSIPNFRFLYHHSQHESLFTSTLIFITKASFIKCLLVVWDNEILFDLIHAMQPHNLMAFVWKEISKENNYTLNCLSRLKINLKDECFNSLRSFHSWNVCWLSESISLMQCILKIE